MNWIRSFNRDFDALVSLCGARPALVAAGDEERKLSYAELDAVIDRTLAWLRAHGVNQGDTVGAVLPNSMEMLSIFLACMRGGLGFAPLACDTTQNEVRRWAELIKPKLICFSPVLNADVAATLKSTGLPGADVVSNGKFAHLPVQSENQPHYEGGRLYLFSSGTTGAPKAIVLDVDRLWSAGHAFVRLHGAEFDKPFRIWNYLPQSYLGGLFNLALIPFTIGGTVVIDDVFSGKTFLGFWQTVQRYDINVLWLVPSIVRGLITLGERTHRNEVLPDAPKIDLAFLGTAPIEVETKRKFERLFGLRLLENFALSETTFLTSEMRGDNDIRGEGSTGRKLPYAELAFRPVAEESDRYNEILVRSPFLMLGYLGDNGELTTPDEDGFFPTGDLGYLDEHGQLVLTGRNKDVIKKGGYFIALREIELLAQTHAQVIEAAAVATPHPFYGESYRLLIRLKSDAPADAAQSVTDFVFAALAKHKWPDSVEAVAEFPRTASGKIRKFLLKRGAE